MKKADRVIFSTSNYYRVGIVNANFGNGKLSVRVTHYVFEGNLVKQSQSDVMVDESLASLYTEGQELPNTPSMSTQPNPSTHVNFNYFKDALVFHCRSTDQKSVIMTREFFEDNVVCSFDSSTAQFSVSFQKEGEYWKMTDYKVSRFAGKSLKLFLYTYKNRSVNNRVLFFNIIPID